MAFTKRQQHVTNKPSEHATEVTVSSDDTDEAVPSDDDETPVITTAQTILEPEIKEIEVAEVVPVVEEKMVTIVPRITLTSVRIGPNMYSFLKGVPVKVPAGVRAHLQEKGVI